MLFRQFVDDDLGLRLLSDRRRGPGEAVVVDPAYAIEQYLEQAEQDGVRIVRVLETHTHADHVSGHGRLALEHGAAGLDPRRRGAGVSVRRRSRTARSIEVGTVAIRVLHTPGHRPEHCCFAVIDRERGDEPWLTLTGDSLFVGDAARPDLAFEAAEGAHGLYRSLQRLLELDDGVEIYPGHVAGSLCGAGMSSEGLVHDRLRAALQPELRLTARTSSSPSAHPARRPRPPNMDRIVELNRGPFVGAPEPLER